MHAKQTQVDSGSAVATLRTIYVLIVLLLGSPFNQPAEADTNIELILSLECLIDSSSIIGTARLELKDGAEGKYRFNEMTDLKSHINDEGLNAAVEDWELPYATEDGDEFLLFILKHRNSHEIHCAINLTRPLQNPKTAAVTKDLIALPDKKCILKAAKARIALDRRLDFADCFRWVSRSQDLWREDRVVQDYHGCFPHPPHFSYCDYWNREGPYNYATDVYVIVPADPEYRQELLSRLGHDEKKAVSMDIVSALINYPGEDTVAALERFRDGKDERAHEVLEYLAKQKGK